MLEGGGQILRNASALAAITGVPVAVDRIRAKRSKPGLQPQHLTSLQLVQALCGAQLTGSGPGRQQVTRLPSLHCAFCLAAQARESLRGAVVGGLGLGRAGRGWPSRHRDVFLFAPNDPTV